MISNPLRDPRDRRLPRVPEPCALVVFGITGDLARKKLMPAVYDLANRGLLPTNFALLGFARRDWGDSEFAELARDSARKAARTPWREEVWERLAPSVHFVPGSFDDDNAFDALAETLQGMEGSHGIGGNAAFYLSIPPSMFPVVLKQMQRTGMSESTPDRWRRVVVEKPFGHDLASSRELNELVDSVFTADDVFRIDHYLGKETVQNLLAMRFANTLFEPVWNGHHVDSVQITMAEDVGIGGRAGFYEKTGAARDVLQNHLLQLLALTAMEEPVNFSAEDIATEKLKVLQAISLPDDLETAAVRGQYEQGWLAGDRVQGYQQEEGVDPRSTTETYAAVRFGVETRRWAGVPFYLRTGKRLPRRVTEIALVFKRAPHLPFSRTDTEELGNNQLVVRVQPDEGITLKFGSKVPGSVMEVRDVAMDFLYGEQFTEASPEAYERLLLDVLLGDATLFPRNAEVEASWRAIDPLEEFWAGSTPQTYRAGEWGPRAADEMLAAEGQEVEATVTTLWDTTGSAVVKELAAQRRTGGAVLSGVALTLVVVADEARVTEAEEAATHAAQTHPCRVLVVVRRQLEAAVPRLDAEVLIGGRLGPGEAVVMRMYGRLGLHAESVVLPLLAADAPVVAWWHAEPPGQLATDALAVIADRRITDSSMAAEPLAALRSRAADYAPGDTDLAWTRSTAWRGTLTSTVDSVAGRRGEPVQVLGARVEGDPGNATAQLLAGWISARCGCGVEVGQSTRTPGVSGVDTVVLQLDRDEEVRFQADRRGGAMIDQPHRPQMTVALPERPLGDLLGEELRRLDRDEPFSEALEAATSVTGLATRSPVREHVWFDPAEGRPDGAGAAPRARKAKA